MRTGIAAFFCSLLGSRQGRNHNRAPVSGSVERYTEDHFQRDLGETVDPTIIVRATFVLVFVVVAGYSALRIWRLRDGPDSMDRSEGFRPRIGFTRLDGMASLSVLLANGSRNYVWVEEIEIFLSSLIAEVQTADASCHEIQKIRQMIPPSDTLPMSLSEVIYKAAGDPQRKYSCVLSSVLRYRIDETQYEKKMENYRVHMLGLTASSIHRERKPIPPFQPQKKSHDVPELQAKHK
jgi:hypothetical protein